ncbi:MAG: carboxypeptidase-like regulatory domain-containing protein [Gemmatimonadota bacterium]
MEAAMRSVGRVGGRALVLACALACSGVTGLAAQSLVRGQLQHASSGQPVVGAVVELLGLADERFGATVSDSVGMFRLVAPGPGEYRVRVLHADYERIVSETLRVLKDGEGVDLVLFLGIQGYELAPLQVIGRADARMLSGRESFERHQALGKGRFITAEEIMAKKPPGASHVLRAEEGVIPFALPDGSMGYRALRGAKPCIYTVINGQWAGRSGLVMVDSGRGVIAATEAMVNAITTPNRDGPIRHPGLDALLSPEEIAGIEFFREFNEVPEEWKREAWQGGDGAFGGLQACGLVVIWTRAAW